MHTIMIITVTVTQHYFRYVNLLLLLGAPELVDRLILALGLGSSGQHISSSHAPQERIGLPGPPIIYNNQQICHHIYSTIGMVKILQFILIMGV